MNTSYNEFLINVGEMRKGGQSQFSGEIASSFIERDNEIRDASPITLEYTAYVTNDFLILDVKAKTALTLVCSLCSHPFSFPVEFHLQHEEELGNIPKGIFNLIEFLRETILLEVPFFPLCGGQSCSNRGQVDRFLKKEETESTHFHPFEDIQIDIPRTKKYNP
jgi:uncharacterized metal-binding protein YceD (DUF177 family)